MDDKIRELEQRIRILESLVLGVSRDLMPAPNESWQDPDCVCPGALNPWRGLPPQMEGWDASGWQGWTYPLNPECPLIAEHRHGFK